MRCCHCNQQIDQAEINKALVHEIFGTWSHLACDDKQLLRQEKLVKYGKGHMIETEQI